MEIGSIWNKWDLHIHTPSSFENNFRFIDEFDKLKYNNNIWDKYIDELEKIEDFPVIGITDYYSIEGYEKISLYQNEGRLTNFKLILPNIEFRMDVLVPKKNSHKKINFHVIFSNDIDLKDIKSKFLESLTIYTTGLEPRRLTKDNIEEIGRELRATHTKFEGMGDNFFIGMMNIYIDMKEVLEKLEKMPSIFKGKYLIVLPEALWNELSWDGQDHLLRKQLFTSCNAIFSSNESTIDWALGKKGGLDDFIREFGRPKPCIHGSDAHQFDKLCHPDLNRFCWIKGDCTFEGLKQIIYEPFERIKISEFNPESEKNIYTLSSIKIEGIEIGEKLKINDTSIPINRNLVAIIGGKGTGKTALLDVIANCFFDQCYRKAKERKNNNSFIQRIEDLEPEFLTSIEFIDPEIERFDKKLLDNVFFEKSKISYLPQGQIEEYCGNEDKLELKIHEIIFNNIEVINSGLLNKYNDINQRIRRAEQEIRNYNMEIYNLETDASNEKLMEIKRNINLTEGELLDRKKSLTKFLELHKIPEDGKVDTLQQEENALKINHSNLINLKLRIQEFSTNFINQVGELNQNIKEINSNLEDQHFHSKIPLVQISIQKDKLNEANVEIDDKTKEILDQLKLKSKEIADLTGFQKNQSEILRQMEDVSSRIRGFNKELSSIDSMKRKIQDFKQKRKLAFIILIKNFFRLKKCYKDIIKVFARGKSEILDEIDFHPKISMNEAEFLEKADDIFHGKKVRDVELNQIKENFLKIIQNKEEIKENIETYLNAALEYQACIKKSRTAEEFYNLIYMNPFKILTEILYAGKLLEKLSIGQKGTVLLKLMLAEGDYPLLIDQPEENLDNNFIYVDLVNAMKDAKKKRQIILATHNANLVVNTDSEQVIVAKFFDNTISYISGSLENTTIKNEITTLLEGGKDAFKKREEKYGF